MIERPTTSTRRVLHLIDSLGLGGAQAILANYFESRASDSNIFLMSLRHTNREATIHHPNVAIASSSSRFSLSPLWQARALISRRKIDVVHCHLFRSQVFGAALKTLFFPRLRVIFHEHGRVVGSEGESRLEVIAFRLFLRCSALVVERFICISEVTRKALLRIAPGVGARAVVVSNPIRMAPARACDGDGTKSGIEAPQGALVVGFAARLVHRKGWREFLQAVAIARRQISIFYVMAGDGEDRAKVEAVIRANDLQDSGRVLGHVTDMDAFYRALNCFVAPPHWEPHGLSHLEAQSYGLPVVVSDVEGLSATVHPEVDALLFKAGNASDLASQLLRLAADAKLRIRLGDRGRVNARAYGIEAFAAALERVYAMSPNDSGVRPLPTVAHGETPNH